MWLGIGGYGEGPAAPDYHGPGNLVQAGTQQNVGGLGYYAWVCWFPHLIRLNLPIAPLDVIGGWLFAPAPNFVMGILVNETQRVAANFVVGPPTPEKTIDGATVEWIFERTWTEGLDHPNSFPAFTQTFFSLASGGTGSGMSFTINDGTLLSMAEDGQTVCAVNLNGISLMPPS
jgi:hypothetical protein